jgi:hypothetical protein
MSATLTLCVEALHAAHCVEIRNESGRKWCLEIVVGLQQNMSE